MRQLTDLQAFDALPVEEKIRHVQDLWDRIAASPGDIEVTPAQRDELERRLRDHEENPGEYITWEELRARLEKKWR